MPTFRCEVLTPYRRLFDGEVVGVHFVTYDGEMEILAGHEPIVAPVSPCVLRLDLPEGRKLAAATEGLTVITPDRMQVFLDTAEWVTDIDRKRAEDSLARAQTRLAEGAMSWETTRARAAAARARARLATLAAAAQQRGD